MSKTPPKGFTIGAKVTPGIVSESFKERLEVLGARGAARFQTERREEKDTKASARADTAPQIRRD